MEIEDAEEYTVAEIVPIPAKCPRCKRNFLGRDAIRAPSLDNCCCFYCGPNRTVHLVPHPEHPVIDAKTRRHGLLTKLHGPALAAALSPSVKESPDANV